MFGLSWKLLGGAGLALALSLGWGVRVNHLRAGYHEQLSTIRIAFKDMGETVKGFDDLVPVANKVGAERARYKQERDQAQQVVTIQSDSITALEQESEEAARKATEHRLLIAEVTRQRNAWIKRAKDAETRTERLSAEEELKECEQVLDSLYAAGF